jgi:hypothetical protein
MMSVSHSRRHPHACTDARDPDRDGKHQGPATSRAPRTLHSAHIGKVRHLVRPSCGVLGLLDPTVTLVLRETTEEGSSPGVVPRPPDKAMGLVAQAPREKPLLRAIGFWAPSTYRVRGAEVYRAKANGSPDSGARSGLAGPRTLCRCRRRPVVLGRSVRAQASQDDLPSMPGQASMSYLRHGRAGRPRHLGWHDRKRAQAPPADRTRRGLALGPRLIPASPVAGAPGSRTARATGARCLPGGPGY